MGRVSTQRGGSGLTGIPPGGSWDRQEPLRAWRLCSHHRGEKGQGCVCVWRWGVPLKVPASSGFSARRARSSGRRGAPARGDRGWGPSAQHADGGQVDLWRPASPGRRGAVGPEAGGVGAEGGGSLAGLRDQHRWSKTHTQTTIATLPCAAAAHPWDGHPEGCTDRRTRIPAPAPPGPQPGPAPARLPWSELARASNAAAAPG